MKRKPRGKDGCQINSAKIQKNSSSVVSGWGMQEKHSIVWNGVRAFLQVIMTENSCWYFFIPGKTNF